MAKPATPFTWATDTNYTHGPDVGTPTKVAPSSGVRAEGFVAKTAAVPQFQNELFSEIAAWLAYVNGLPTDAQFLASTFAFTGQQTQTQEYNYATPKTFSKWLNVADGTPYNTSSPGSSINTFVDGFTTGNARPGMWWQSNSAASDKVIYDLDLPTGAVVTNLRLVVGATDTTHLVFAQLGGWTMNPTSGAQGSLVSMRVNASGAGTGTINGDIVVSVDAVGATSQVIDRSANMYELSVAIRDVPGGSAQAVLKGIWVEYTMPGYRNG